MDGVYYSCGLMFVYIPMDLTYEEFIRIIVLYVYSPMESQISNVLSYDLPACCKQAQFPIEIASVSLNFNTLRSFYK